MTTLTASRLAEMPKVNLLPPEIAEANRLRRLQALLGFALLLVLALVVLLFMWASNQVSTADDELAAAQTRGADLEAQKASFAEVPAVMAEVDAAEAALVTAMQPEIRWSVYLNDLSLGIPSTSRLTALTAINSAAAIQIDPATVVPPTQLGVPTLGSIGYVGRSTDVDATSVWLVSQMRQEGLIAPQVQSFAESTEGPFFEFESTVEVGLDGASERYTRIEEGS